MEKTLMGLDSTNRDYSFWDTIGTQTTTRDTIFRFGTQFRPFGTQSGTVFMALALALARLRLGCFFPGLILMI